MPKDLRSFIAEVTEQRPDQIKLITDEVDPRFGVTAVAAKLEKQGEFPALYFETVGDTELPAIVNLTATYDRLALALGTDVQHMVPHYAEKQAHPIPPEIVHDAPVKEVVWTGPDADLTRLPIPTHNALDGGPYLTGAMLVARDPETGLLNVGLPAPDLQPRRAGGVVHPQPSWWVHPAGVRRDEPTDAGCNRDRAPPRRGDGRGLPHPRDGRRIRRSRRATR